MKRTLIILAASFFMLTVLAGAVFYAVYQPGYVCAVLLDGEEIGCVEEFEEYSAILAELLEAEEAATELELSFAQDIMAEKQFAWKPETDPDGIKDVLTRQVSYTAVGWAIEANGEPLVYLDSAETAQSVIDMVKDSVVAERPNRHILTVEIIDEISISSHSVLPEQVVETDEAYELMLRGHERVDTYTVARGDNLWSISRSLDLTQKQLEDANPGLDSDALQPGQELNLVRVEPQVSIRVVEEASVIESIPYTTQYRSTGSLWYYQSRTAQQGKSGKRERVYEVEYIDGAETARKEIETRVVAEPQTRIIQRGTSYWPSSATGSFRWPLNSGKITDRFGAFQSWRAQRHTGVDIGASSGSPIYAAASGRVTQAGWVGSYGLLVEIDHGNGYSTRYAHASSLNVSAGQSVSRGQLIARVGSTGNSTGSHLHYEIRRNGKPVDPLQFYAP